MAACSEARVQPPSISIPSCGQLLSTRARASGATVLLCRPRMWRLLEPGAGLGGALGEKAAARG